MIKLYRDMSFSHIAQSYVIVQIIVVKVKEDGDGRVQGKENTLRSKTVIRNSGRREVGLS